MLAELHLLTLLSMSLCVALLELRAEHERSVEEVRSELKSSSELERQRLCEGQRREVGALQRVLGERETRLAEMASELACAQAALEERGQGLGEVEGEVERLREEGRALVEKEKASQRECEQLKV